MARPKNEDLKAIQHREKRIELFEHLSDTELADTARNCQDQGMAEDAFELLKQRLYAAACEDVDRILSEFMINGQECPDGFVLE